jgi:hypothetical protein
MNRPTTPGCLLEAAERPAENSDPTSSGAKDQPVEPTLNKQIEEQIDRAVAAREIPSLPTTQRSHEVFDDAFQTARHHYPADLSSVETETGKPNLDGTVLLLRRLV